jgi:hypothetical protein
MDEAYQVILQEIIKNQPGETMKPTTIEEEYTHSIAHCRLPALSEGSSIIERQK